MSLEFASKLRGYAGYSHTHREKYFGESVGNSATGVTRNQRRQTQPLARAREAHPQRMNPRDLLRSAQIGAIELQLRLLEAGGAPSSAPAAEMSERETARRVAFCANIGERLLDRRLTEPEVNT